MGIQELKAKSSSSVESRSELFDQDDFIVCGFGSYQVIVTRDALEQYGEEFPWRFAEVIDVLNERLELGMELPLPIVGNGRGKNYFLLLPQGKNLILRYFLRGGFVSKFNKDLHFLLPGKGVKDTRPYRELLILRYLYKLGVNVPEPVAGVVNFLRKKLFYRATIATIEIPNSVNLLELTKGPDQSTIEDQLVEAAFAAGIETRKVLEAGVLHRDLHLGNVLVDNQAKVYLIDFDRAFFQMDPLTHPRYYDFIIERWKRSVRKHNCDLALEPFVAGLLKG